MRSQYERHVLCTMIAFPEVIAEHEISVDLFDDPSRSEIARRVIELERARKPVDQQIIKRGLSDDESREELLYIVSLTPVANLSYYIKEIKEEALKKSLTSTLLEAVDKAQKCDDMMGLIDYLSGELVRISTRGSVSSEILAYDGWMGAINELKSAEFFSTGFEIDESLKIKRGDLIVIGARPSVGKSALAIALARNFIYRGKSVAFYSLEMSANQILLRVIAQEKNIPIDSIQSRAKSVALIPSTMKNLIIDDSPLVGIDTLRNRIKRLIGKNKVDIIIVDYLQLMIGVGINRYEIVSEISRGLKLLAKELNVAIIALSQLNRGIEQRESKKPMLSDLRESGSIEQDADAVLFLSNAKGNQKHLEIVKNRSGATKNFTLSFDPNTTLFY